MLKSYKLHLLLAIIALQLISCTNKDKNNSNTIAVDKNENGLPIIQESKVKYKKLDANYVNSKRAAVENFCDKYWRNQESCLSFLVAQNGQIIYERYQGYANRNKKIKIAKDIPLHIASVSKVITATAVLLLIQDHKIELDQKVNTILKNFPYPDITIETLLNHRSGLRNYAYFLEDEGVWDLKKTVTNQDVLNLLSEKNIQLESKPNTRFSYCNTNYALLALIVEKISGLKFGEAMNEMIFKPLKMKNTFVFDLERDRKIIAPSYKGNNMELALDHLDAVYGDKNVYSTPRDMLKFDLARNAPTFLNPKLRALVYKGYSNERKGEKNYGLGIRMLEWDNGQKFYFHNGWWHGNTSSYIPLMNENVTIIALSNKFTRNTYAVRKLVPIFGDYPFQFDTED
ncbi:MAG TPA: serine hydrolase domain-containing protein [Flavobacterium sp.]|nr:serine hydrolase domain-containing protein [Flavobacterium sp.]